MRDKGEEGGIRGRGDRVRARGDGRRHRETLGKVVSIKSCTDVYAGGGNSRVRGSR